MSLMIEPTPTIANVRLDPKARRPAAAPALVEPAGAPVDYYPLQKAHSSRKMYAQHMCAYTLAARQLIGRPAAGVRVLDAGCGRGYGTAFLADHGVQAVGVDLLVDQVAEARALFARPALSYAGMNLLAMGFPDSTFDLISSFQVIEHIPVDGQIVYLREIARVLAPRGVFVLSTLNRAAAVKSEKTYRPNPDHTHEFVWPEMLELLRRVFRVVHPYSLFPTVRQRTIQTLKRSGLCRSLPARWNPVTRFYEGVRVEDFAIRPGAHPRTIDLLCLCKVR